jgi:hypothetical protein
MMGLHLLAMPQLFAYFVEKFEHKTTERLDSPDEHYDFEQAVSS